MHPQTYRIGVNVDLFSLLAEVPREEGKPATLRMPVLPEGEFDHPTYGKLDWSPKRFAVMIANHEKRVTGFAPMLNVDHATHNPFAASAPAYGWVQSLAHEPGTGLVAEVELTDLGEEAIRCKRYRYLSAEVGETWKDSKGAEHKDVFSGLALTNQPFHETMPGLFTRDQVSGAWGFQATGAAGVPAIHDAAAAPTATQEKHMDPLKFLRRLFGLSEGTSDEEVMLTAVRSAQPEPQKLEAIIGEPVRLAADTVTLSRIEADQLRAQAAEVQEFKRQAEASAQAAKDAQTALLSREAAAGVDACIQAGKVLPAQREDALKFALSDPLLFKALFDGAKPQLDLTARGGLTPDPRTAEGAAPETFAAKVSAHLALCQRSGRPTTYAEAAEEVANDHPELYDAHRAKTLTSGRA
jgi:phage I-like protein